MYNKKDEVQILSLEMVIISRFISFRCLYIPASAEWKEQPNRGSTAQTGQVHAENRTSTGQVAYGSVGLFLFRIVSFDNRQKSCYFSHYTILLLYTRQRKECVLDVTL